MTALFHFSDCIGNHVIKNNHGESLPAFADRLHLESTQSRVQLLGLKARIAPLTLKLVVTQLFLSHATNVFQRMRLALLSALREMELDEAEEEIHRTSHLVTRLRIAEAVTRTFLLPAAAPAPGPIPAQQL